MVGESVVMRRLRALIDLVAPTRLPVLIHGPTGVGKELVAAAVHEASGRGGALVAFNVCAISDSMFEDAMFGHVRGAYTGAWSDSAGFLSEADGGTAFFDEIGGLDPAMQAKLLRAIETGVFRPVGAKRDVASDFRVVAATNERPADLVAAKRFRADFLHRVGAVFVEVPAVRDRLDDLPLLIYHFLARAGSSARVTVEALAVMQSHDWPGNVRELRHVVEWAATMCDGFIGADAIRAAMTHSGAQAEGKRNDVGAELRDLASVLDQHEWNTTLAAQYLGVHRATLYRRMKRLGLSGPSQSGLTIRTDSQAVARQGANARE